MDVVRSSFVHLLLGHRTFNRRTENVIMTGLGHLFFQVLRRGIGILIVLVPDICPLVEAITLVKQSSDSVELFLLRYMVPIVLGHLLLLSRVLV